MSYPSVNFREAVLWPIVRQVGGDPQVELLQDQADELVDHINKWVHKLWESTDWPEWTSILHLPVNETHLIPLFLDAPPGSVLVARDIGRVFRVYLVDPAQTPGPTDTAFRLTDRGLHVGFAHGSSVWVKCQAPAPVFSAQAWDAGITYQKNQVVYLPRTGECYKSKTNNNLGHDPITAGAPPPPGEPIVPPAPPPSPPPPSPPPPFSVPLVTEVTQDRTPDNPGMIETPEILVLDFDNFKTNQLNPIAFHIPDPPPDNDLFFITIADQDGTSLASASIAGNGILSLATLLDSVATTLLAGLPAGFAVTSDPTMRTVTISDLSVFKAKYAYYETAAGIDYYPLQIIQQSYLPAVPGVAGQSQVTKLVVTQDQVSTGTTYQLDITDPFGVVHSVQYTALAGDSSIQILNGLAAAVQASRTSDPYFDSVSTTVDTATSELHLATADVASIHGAQTAPASPFWVLVPFPLRLRDQVVEGATADAMVEQGQTDKSQVQNQMADQTNTEAMSSSLSNPYDILTDQQKPRSRYARAGGR